MTSDGASCLPEILRTRYADLLAEWLAAQTRDAQQPD